MNQELEDKILYKYYDIFYETKKGKEQSTMISNIECGDGWFDILWRLFEDIYAMKPKILQVKEKCGGLRVYASFPQDYTEQGWRRISKAEEEASETCEFCGKPGELRFNKNNWKVTQCNNCVAEDEMKDH